MGNGGAVGRVGALAVALGIGSAVMVGGCPIAAADSAGTSRVSGNATSAEQPAPSEQNESPPRSVDTDPTTRNPVEDIASRVRGALRDAFGRRSPQRAEGVTTPGSDTRERKRAEREEAALTRPDKRVTLASADAADPNTDPGREPIDSATVEHESIAGIPRSAPATTIEVRAAADQRAPAIHRGLVGTVVAAVRQVFAPLSANSTPDTPAVTPAAWVLLAAARREINQTMHPRMAQAGGVVAERQLEATAASTTLAPGIVVPPELSDKVTATGKPSLMGIITVRAMEVIKRVSQFIGVNITMQLGRVITTPTPPWFTTIGLDVTKDTYEGGDVWVISRPNPTDERVIAVHGSGFIFNPNIIHWMDYAQMARETGATVIVPRYPLIPNGGTAANSVPAMADFIANEVQTYGAENVSVYADSAGGTLSALAVQKIVRECNGNSECLATRVPSRMVLLSPGLQGEDAYTDPNVALVNDPVVWLTEADKEYYGSWASGPEELWNPMIGPTEGMPPTVIYVASREQSAPGALLYAARLVNANPTADISVVIGMGQIHDWAQGGYLPINSQAAKYRRAIYQQLGILDVT